MNFRDEPQRRANEYARKHGLTLGKELGFGVHGCVFATEVSIEDAEAGRQSAIKAHYREVEYVRERDVYIRLLECDVSKIRNCRVPQFIACDDALWIIEMTIVQRPYVLDFGGAYLDHAPEFSEEVMADWRAEKAEQFGEHWAEAQAILRALETYGIFVIDVNTNNIAIAPRKV